MDNYKRVGLEIINSFVKEKYDGICLSPTYKNNRTNLIFQCKYNHNWNATWSNIAKGKWCPNCNKFSSERIVRLYMETIFNAKFEKARPDWLIAPSGFKMELDGFNNDLKIAFEHQGMQHYKINEFANTYDKLNKIKCYDSLKAKLCKDNNINLIIIPQLNQLTPLNKLIDLIIKQSNLKLNKDIKININLDLISAEYLNKYKQIALKRNGLCLSDNYINSNYKLKFRCKDNHEWEALPYNILKGHWCKICGGKIARNKQLANIRINNDLSKLEHLVV